MFLSRSHWLMLRSLLSLSSSALGFVLLDQQLGVPAGVVGRRAQLLGAEVQLGGRAVRYTARRQDRRNGFHEGPRRGGSPFATLGTHVGRDLVDTWRIWKEIDIF